MLRNTVYKLQNKLPLTVGYLGGSITEGAGVKDEKDCWRCKLTEWFKEQYPDSEITELNAGIGGTGSDFGMFRCDRQITDFKPDLVFVEFAVNDHNSDKSLDCMETIIRKLMRVNPLTDIVLVQTAMKAIHDELTDGKPIKSYNTYNKLALYYGLDIIDVGGEIITRTESGEGDWSTYTTDNVHPNIQGYVLYTNKIIRYLKKELAMAQPLTSDKFGNAHMVDISECTTDFETVSKSFCGRENQYIEASEKGKFIELKFTGCCIGIYNMIASDSGDLLWSIDGGEPQRCSTWDKYALEFDRTNYCIFTDNLEYGEHTLRIEVLGECNEKSKGNYIRIGAFLAA